MHKLKTILRQPEIRWLIFALSAIFLGWPLLTIMNRQNNSNIFIYLFVLWGIIIFLLFIITRSIQAAQINGHSDQDEAPKV